MQLHRTTGQPDWATVPAGQRNVWQRLAARSKGIVTPGNALTIGGLGLVLFGLFALNDRHFWISLAAVLLGRICDLADGIVAQATGTKSPLGESLDATADKLTILGIVYVFWQTQLVPGWVLLTILEPQALVSGISLGLHYGHQVLHPSRLGKYNTAVVWAILPGFVLAYALHMSHSWLMTTLRICAVITAAVELYIAYIYATQRD
jgi:phosphatidylglycerophosphate synthase